MKGGVVDAGVVIGTLAAIVAVVGLYSVYSIWKCASSAVYAGEKRDEILERRKKMIARRSNIRTTVNIGGRYTNHNGGRRLFRGIKSLLPGTSRNKNTLESTLYEIPEYLSLCEQLNNKPFSREAVNIISKWFFNLKLLTKKNLLKTFLINRNSLPKTDELLIIKNVEQQIMNEITNDMDEKLNGEIEHTVNELETIQELAKQEVAEEAKQEVAEEVKQEEVNQELEKLEAGGSKKIKTKRKIPIKRKKLTKRRIPIKRKKTKRRR